MKKYEIYVEKNVQKWLKKQSENFFVFIINAVRKLEQNPRPSGCRKIKNESNLWRIRIGDYRVLYEIYDDERIVKIINILHRKDVYKNLLI